MSSGSDMDADVVSSCRSFFTSMLEEDKISTPSTQAHDMVRVACQQIRKCVVSLALRMSPNSLHPITIDELKQEYVYDNDTGERYSDTMNSTNDLYCCYTALFFVKKAFRGWLWECGQLNGEDIGLFGPLFRFISCLLPVLESAQLALGTLYLEQHQCVCFVLYREAVGVISSMSSSHLMPDVNILQRNQVSLYVEEALREKKACEIVFSLRSRRHLFVATALLLPCPLPSPHRQWSNSRMLSLSARRLVMQQSLLDKIISAFQAVSLDDQPVLMQLLATVVCLCLAPYQEQDIDRVMEHGEEDGEENLSEAQLRDEVLSMLGSFEVNGVLLSCCKQAVLHFCSRVTFPSAAPNVEESSLLSLRQEALLFCTSGGTLEPATYSRSRERVSAVMAILHSLQYLALARMSLVVSFVPELAPNDESDVNGSHYEGNGDDEWIHPPLGLWAEARLRVQMSECTVSHHRRHCHSSAVNHYPALFAICVAKDQQEQEGEVWPCRDLTELVQVVVDLLPRVLSGTQALSKVGSNSQSSTAEELTAEQVGQRFVQEGLHFLTLLLAIRAKVRSQPLLRRLPLEGLAYSSLAGMSAGVFAGLCRALAVAAQSLHDTDESRLSEGHLKHVMKQMTTVCATRSDLASSFLRLLQAVLVTWSGVGGDICSDVQAVPWLVSMLLKNLEKAGSGNVNSSEAGVVESSALSESTHLATVCLCLCIVARLKACEGERGGSTSGAVLVLTILKDTPLLPYVYRFFVRASLRCSREKLSDCIGEIRSVGVLWHLWGVLMASVQSVVGPAPGEEGVDGLENDLVQVLVEASGEVLLGGMGQCLAVIAAQVSTAQTEAAGSASGDESDVSCGGGCRAEVLLLLTTLFRHTLTSLGTSSATPLLHHSRGTENKRHRSRDGKDKKQLPCYCSFAQCPLYTSARLLNFRKTHPHACQRGVSATCPADVWLLRVHECSSRAVLTWMLSASETDHINCSSALPFFTFPSKIKSGVDIALTVHAFFADMTRRCFSLRAGHCLPSVDSAGCSGGGDDCVDISGGEMVSSPMWCSNVRVDVVLGPMLQGCLALLRVAGTRERPENGTRYYSKSNSDCGHSSGYCGAVRSEMGMVAEVVTLMRCFIDCHPSLAHRVAAPQVTPLQQFNARYLSDTVHSFVTSATSLCSELSSCLVLCLYNTSIVLVSHNRNIDQKALVPSATLLSHWVDMVCDLACPAPSGSRWTLHSQWVAALMYMLETLTAHSCSHFWQHETAGSVTHRLVQFYSTLLQLLVTHGMPFMGDTLQCSPPEGVHLSALLGCVATAVTSLTRWHLPSSVFWELLGLLRLSTQLPAIRLAKGVDEGEDDGEGGERYITQEWVYDVLLERESDENSQNNNCGNEVVHQCREYFGSPAWLSLTMGTNGRRVGVVSGVLVTDQLEKGQNERPHWGNDLGFTVSVWLALRCPAMTAGEMTAAVHHTVFSLEGSSEACYPDFSVFLCQGRVCVSVCGPSHREAIVTDLPLLTPSSSAAPSFHHLVVRYTFSASAAQSGRLVAYLDGTVSSEQRLQYAVSTRIPRNAEVGEYSLHVGTSLCDCFHALVDGPSPSGSGNDGDVDCDRACGSGSGSDSDSDNQLGHELLLGPLLLLRTPLSSTEIALLYAAGPHCDNVQGAISSPVSVSHSGSLRHSPRQSQSQSQSRQGCAQDDCEVHLDLRRCSPLLADEVLFLSHSDSPSSSTLPLSSLLLASITPRHLLGRRYLPCPSNTHPSPALNSPPSLPTAASISEHFNGRALQVWKDWNADQFVHTTKESQGRECFALRSTCCDTHKGDGDAGQLEFTPLVATSDSERVDCAGGGKVIFFPSSGTPSAQKVETSLAMSSSWLSLTATLVALLNKSISSQEFVRVLRLVRTLGALKGVNADTAGLCVQAVMAGIRSKMVEGMFREPRVVRECVMLSCLVLRSVRPSHGHSQSCSVSITHPPTLQHECLIQDASLLKMLLRDCLLCPEVSSQSFSLLLSGVLTAQFDTTSRFTPVNKKQYQGGNIFQVLLSASCHPLSSQGKVMALFGIFFRALLLRDFLVKKDLFCLFHLGCVLGDSCQDRVGNNRHGFILTELVSLYGGSGSAGEEVAVRRQCRVVHQCVLALLQQSIGVLCVGAGMTFDALEYADDDDFDEEEGDDDDRDENADGSKFSSASMSDDEFYSEEDAAEWRQPDTEWSRLMLDQYKLDSQLLPCHRYGLPGDVSRLTLSRHEHFELTSLQTTQSKQLRVVREAVNIPALLHLLRLYSVSYFCPEGEDASHEVGGSVVVLRLVVSLLASDAAVHAVAPSASRDASRDTLPTSNSSAQSEKSQTRQQREHHKQQRQLQQRQQQQRQRHAEHTALWGEHLISLKASVPPLLSYLMTTARTTSAAACDAGYADVESDAFLPFPSSYQDLCSQGDRRSEEVTLSAVLKRMHSLHEYIDSFEGVMEFSSTTAHAHAGGEVSPLLVAGLEAICDLLLGRPGAMRLHGSSLLTDSWDLSGQQSSPSSSLSASSIEPVYIRYAAASIPPSLASVIAELRTVDQNQDSGNDCAKDRSEQDRARRAHLTKTLRSEEGKADLLTGMLPSMGVAVALPLLLKTASDSALLSSAGAILNSVDAQQDNVMDRRAQAALHAATASKTALSVVCLLYSLLDQSLHFRKSLFTRCLPVPTCPDLSPPPLLIDLFLSSVLKIFLAAGHARLIDLVDGDKDLAEAFDSWGKGAQLPYQVVQSCCSSAVGGICLQIFTLLLVSDKFRPRPTRLRDAAIAAISQGGEVSGARGVGDRAAGGVGDLTADKASPIVKSETRDHVSSSSSSSSDTRRSDAYRRQGSSSSSASSSSSSSSSSCSQAPVPTAAPQLVAVTDLTPAEKSYLHSALLRTLGQSPTLEKERYKSTANVEKSMDSVISGVDGPVSAGASGGPFRHTPAPLTLPPLPSSVATPFLFVFNASLRRRVIDLHLRQLQGEEEHKGHTSLPVDSTTPLSPHSETLSSEITARHLDLSTFYVTSDTRLKRRLYCRQFMSKLVPFLSELLFFELELTAVTTGSYDAHLNAKVLLPLSNMVRLATLLGSEAIDGVDKNKVKSTTTSSRSCEKLSGNGLVNTGGSGGGGGDDDSAGSSVKEKGGWGSTLSGWSSSLLGGKKTTGPLTPCVDSAPTAESAPTARTISHEEQRGLGITVTPTPAQPYRFGKFRKNLTSLVTQTFSGGGGLAGVSVSATQIEEEEQRLEKAEESRAIYSVVVAARKAAVLLLETLREKNAQRKEVLLFLVRHRSIFFCRLPSPHLHPNLSPSSSSTGELLLEDGRYAATLSFYFYQCLYDKSDMELRLRSLLCWGVLLCGHRYSHDRDGQDGRQALLFNQESLADLARELLVLELTSGDGSCDQTTSSGSADSGSSSSVHMRLDLWQHGMGGMCILEQLVMVMQSLPLPIDDKCAARKSGTGQSLTTLPANSLLAQQSPLVQSHIISLCTRFMDWLAALEEEEQEALEQRVTGGADGMRAGIIEQFRKTVSVYQKDTEMCEPREAMGEEWLREAKKQQRGVERGLSKMHFQTLSDHEVDRRRELLFGRLSMQHLRKQQSHHSHDNDTMSMTLAHSGFEGWSESAGRGDWELVNSEGPHRSRLRLVCRRGFQPNAEAPLSTTCISSCSSYRSGSGGTESSWTPSPGPGPSPPALILPGDAIEHQTLAEQVEGMDSRPVLCCISSRNLLYLIRDPTSTCDSSSSTVEDEDQNSVASGLLHQGTSLGITGDGSTCSSGGVSYWNIDLVETVLKRRYLLVSRALEIFFVGGRSVFLRFHSSASCDAVMAQLGHRWRGLPLPSGSSGGSLSSLCCAPVVHFSGNTFSAPARCTTGTDTGTSMNMNITAKVTRDDLLMLQPSTDKLKVYSVDEMLKTCHDQWVGGSISNFEYIMHLNTLAGRSFLDWSIYPVFPWVLRDYVSPQLDLEADADLDVGGAEHSAIGEGTIRESCVFRDLSKPMGAITENRKSECVDKFSTLAMQHADQGHMQGYEEHDTVERPGHGDGDGNDNADNDDCEDSDNESDGSDDGEDAKPRHRQSDSDRDRDREREANLVRLESAAAARLVTATGRPYHCGTHYSSSASVLHFLLRLQPYASAHVKFQGGKFDHPDRLFQSISGSWESASGGLRAPDPRLTNEQQRAAAIEHTRHTNMQDVKELVPEFFSLPDFLSNISALDLGCCAHSGKRVNNVLLPPWAHDSPRLFITLHRAALESAHVTRNLHLWLDLIFGSKQQGEEAVRACNVFHYLTYESSLDLNLLRNKTQREAYSDQICSFGQTPRQLFKHPHRPRRVFANGAAIGQASVCASASVSLATASLPTGVTIDGDAEGLNMGEGEGEDVELSLGGGNGRRDTDDPRDQENDAFSPLQITRPGEIIGSLRGLLHDLKPHSAIQTHRPLPTSSSDHHEAVVSISPALSSSSPQTPLLLMPRHCLLLPTPAPLAHLYRLMLLCNCPGNVSAKLFYLPLRAPTPSASAGAVASARQGGKQTGSSSDKEITPNISSAPSAGSHMIRGFQPSSLEQPSSSSHSETCLQQQGWTHFSDLYLPIGQLSAVVYAGLASGANTTAHGLGELVLVAGCTHSPSLHTINLDMSAVYWKLAQHHSELDKGEGTSRHSGHDGMDVDNDSIFSNGHGRMARVMDSCNLLLTRPDIPSQSGITYLTVMPETKGHYTSSAMGVFSVRGVCTLFSWSVPLLPASYRYDGTRTQWRANQPAVFVSTPRGGHFCGHLSCHPSTGDVYSCHGAAVKCWDVNGRLLSVTGAIEGQSNSALAMCVQGLNCASLWSPYNAFLVGYSDGLVALWLVYHCRDQRPAPGAHGADSPLEALLARAYGQRHVVKDTDAMSLEQEYSCLPVLILGSCVDHDYTAAVSVSAVSVSADWRSVLAGHVDGTCTEWEVPLEGE